MPGCRPAEGIASLAGMNPLRPPELPLERSASRRAAVYAMLGGGVMVLPAAPIQYGSRDTERRYRPDSELYYLTGATEPGTVAVLIGGEEPEFILFVPGRDPDAELWAGPRLGPSGASERFAPDACYALSELPETLPQLLARGDRILFRPGSGGEVERHTFEALAKARARGPRTGTGPRGLVDPGEIIDELRLKKDPYELGLLRTAASLSVDGHRAGAAAIAPGVGEWVVEAEMERTFRAGGGLGPAFGTIVGSGSNGCVLHYVTNDDIIAPGSLVLVDAGAEFGHYHGDITRTYPADGSFSGAQREVYDLVEQARSAAVEAIRPGIAFSEVHLAATRVLVEGLLGLGALGGEVDEIIESGAHKQFYPHQTSHWLGLDVHDPGDYTRRGVSRVLEAGMVFTVEPGLYFRPGGSEERLGELGGVGIRIEDDVVVTADGCEVLTSALPTDPDRVAELVQAGW